MGFTAVHGFSFELVLLAVAVLFTGWICYKSWQFKSKLEKQNSQRQQTRKSERDKSKFLINLTLFTNGVYFSGNIFSFVSAAIHLSKAVKNPQRTPIQFRLFSLLWAFQLFAFVHVIFGIILITAVGSERLFVTFDSSSYRVSDETIKIVRLSIALVLVLNVISMASYAFMGFTQTMLMIYLICEPIMVLIFVPINIWFIRGFIKRSLQVYRGIGDSNNHKTQSSLRPSGESNIESSSSSSSPKGAVNLVHTALRVTISCVVPLMMSTFVIFIGVAVSLIGGRLLLFLVRWLFILDWCLSSFTILTTYKWSQPYYEFVFGWLHRWAFSKLFQ